MSKLKYFFRDLGRIKKSFKIVSMWYKRRHPKNNKWKAYILSPSHAPGPKYLRYRIYK